MKKILLNIITPVVVCLSTLPASAQLTVDQVHSDSTALAFVQQQNYSKEHAPQWHFFYLTTGNEWQSYYNFSQQRTQELAAEMHAFKWEKADFNGDGKPDLLVSGYIAKKPGDWATATFKILAFQSLAGKGYAQYNLLTENAEKYPAYMDFIRLDNHNFIRLFRWQLPDKRADRPYQLDTLTFDPYWSSFINVHDATLRRKDIQKIEYRSQEDLQGSYHGLTLDNSNEKRTQAIVALWQKGEKEPETYKAKLTKGLWANLDTLIQKVQPTSFSTNDSVVIHPKVNATDLPVTLTIYFKDGSHKKIIDYGGESTFTLMTVYGCMESITENVLLQVQQRQQMLQGLTDDVFGY